jgi:hypothetical protein
MTKDEALRLALEFIPSISPAFICEASHHKKHEQHASNEPCPHVAKQKQVYEAIKAALEAKDEPVAWVDERAIAWLAEHPNGYITTKLEFQKSFERQMPLYTTPPQRKPLTDEEMKTVVEQELVNYWDGEYIDTTGARDCLTKFARAIEAKHGIKGEA